MADQTEGDDRSFAVALNNEVWDHIDAGDITPESPIDQREALLYAAFASAHHWRRAGNVTNWGRAEHLIARAAVLAGRTSVALEHAARCIGLIESNLDEFEDWDMAFALECLARAQASAGLDAASATKGAAIAATAEVADDGSREVVEGELAREPWFGVI